MNDTAQFFRQPQPMPEWRKLLEVCEQKGVKPDVVVRPKDFKDGLSAERRRNVIKGMRKEGLTVRKIAEVVPLTHRAIREAIAFKRGASTSANSSEQ